MNKPQPLDQPIY